MNIRHLIKVILGRTPNQVVKKNKELVTVGNGTTFMEGANYYR